MSAFGRRPGPLRTLFLHPSGGGLGQYMAVISRLSRRGPVYGIRAAGLQPGETPDDSVEAMLQRYLPLLRTLPGPPDLLLGWSLGGVLAWELAVALAATGHRPAVVMVDSFAEPWSACHTGPGELLGRILSQSSSPEPGAKDRLERTATAHLKASAEHHASRHYDGPVLLMPCAGGEREAQVAAWARRSPRLVTRDLPCGHFEVFQPGHHRLMTRHLDAFLSELPRGSEPSGESRPSAESRLSTVAGRHG
ncbi:alpha/beta fold hydrolase [Streptomyces sp. NPDC005890]|uniref:thioesterase domain-containing protein n=1 Tax=Streptomyces sp. NPDC005890 TaxID=3154568 RepID=UPI0033C0E7F8